MIDIHTCPKTLLLVQNNSNPIGSSLLPNTVEANLITRRRSMLSYPSSQVNVYTIAGCENGVYFYLDDVA